MVCCGWWDVMILAEHYRVQGHWDMLWGLSVSPSLAQSYLRVPHGYCLAIVALNE